MNTNNDLNSLLHKNQRKLFRNLRAEIKDLNEMLTLVANSQNVEAVRRDHMEFLGIVTCRTMTEKEAEMAKEGISFDDLRRITGGKINASLMRESLRDVVSYRHLLRRILAEHEMMLCFVSDISQVNAEIQKLSSWEENPKLVDKVTGILKSVGMLDGHYQREERVILPQLRSYGLNDAPQTVCSEHAEIHKGRVELKKLLDCCGKMELKDWQDRFATVVGRFVPLVRAHIKFEETVLYPSALKLIQDPIKWENMKIACDEIGICCLDE